jgi:hypothetical protein
MRSWYFVMSIFIGVIMVLILLFSSFNNGCTTLSVSLMTTENTPSNQLKYKNGENALPWQLDAVSIGTIHNKSMSSSEELIDLYGLMSGQMFIWIRWGPSSSSA